MPSPQTERRMLQIAIAIAGLVPFGAGLSGALLGAGMTSDHAVSLSLDSHIRYLSGLLLGIGLAFWAAIPRIETHTSRVQVLGAIVFLGGLMRLLGIVLMGVPGPQMLFGLGMELVVTPAICLWQRRVARRVGTVIPGHAQREPGTHA